MKSIAIAQKNAQISGLINPQICANLLLTKAARCGIMDNTRSNNRLRARDRLPPESITHTLQAHPQVHPYHKHKHQ